MTKRHRNAYRRFLGQAVGLLIGVLLAYALVVVIAWLPPLVPPNGTP